MALCAVAVLWCQFVFGNASTAIRTNKAFVIFNNVQQWCVQHKHANDPAVRVADSRNAAIALLSHAASHLSSPVEH